MICQLYHGLFSENSIRNYYSVKLKLLHLIWTIMIDHSDVWLNRSQNSHIWTNYNRSALHTFSRRSLSTTKQVHCTLTIGRTLLKSRLHMSMTLPAITILYNLLGEAYACNSIFVIFKTFSLSLSPVGHLNSSARRTKTRSSRSFLVYHGRPEFTCHTTDYIMVFNMIYQRCVYQ